MTIYSHSKLSTFEQCPLKFKFKYIDKIQPDFKQSIEGFLGNKVHDTLEWVYNHTNKHLLKIDDLIEYYAQSWAKDFNPEIKIVKENLTAETYFNKGIKFLINYFQKHTPFIDNTIATEKKIVLEIYPEKNHQIIGYIDRLVHYKDTNLFEIHDYKTSGTLKSQTELDKDRQLALYSIAIKEQQNASEVNLIWHFLDFNQQVISKRTTEQLKQLKQDIITLIEKIESATEFPPCQSMLCNWCEYQSNCPTINKGQTSLNNF